MNDYDHQNRHCLPSFTFSFILAGIATAIISVTASNLKTDLDNCLEKTAEMDQKMAVNCEPADTECQGQLTKCVQDSEDLVSSIPDLEERIQKLGNIYIYIDYIGNCKL